MDEKFSAKKESLNMLGSSVFLQNESREYSYIPLTNLINGRTKFENCVQEEERILRKSQAANILGTYKTSKNESQKCTYIPLINLRSYKIKCQDSVREVKDSVKNFNSSYNFDMNIEFDTSSISRGISVNTSEENNSLHDLERIASLGGFDAINGFLPPLHCPGQRKVTIKEWTADDYTVAKKELYSCIKYSYKRSLMIWCSTSTVKSELIHSWLKKNTILMYDRWIYKDLPYIKNEWSGVVAIYPDKIAARNAAREIPQQHESLKAIRFSQLMHCFVKSELKYFSEENTQVLVHAKVSSREDVQVIEDMLHKCGQVECCKYDYMIRNSAVDFEATYTFASHALLAKTILDCYPFGSCLLDVEIKMSPKMKAILNDLRFQIKKFIGEEYFPFSESSFV